MPTALTTKFWNVSQLSERLGVPTTWIYDRTRKDGPETIPHLKLGKYIRFDPESQVFQAWLRNHETGCDGHPTNQGRPRENTE